MLRTKNLQFAYHGNAPISFPDVECQANEHWLLLGQSGSGKTTLLHLLAGLRTATSGEVWVDDQSLGHMSASELDRFRGQHIGVIFQQSYFLRALTVKENLAMAQSLSGAAQDLSQIKGLLDRLNLGHKLNSGTNDLSVGEQQRVAIARALINKPSVILADEPTSALDDKNAEEVISLIREQAEEVGATLMIVTHDTRLKAVFDKQVILDPIGKTA
ncbi:MAG: ABC transporter ATP-binding protein [Saprospiraceae bacterium]|nr:ABC transporter ATP-binding protein [Saprospiraceae bacterium]